MPTVKLHGGLHGKERRIRERGRASRMYTQQWIDEFLEPEEISERPRKPIPVRTTSEFLPSVFEFDSIESETLVAEDDCMSERDSRPTAIITHRALKSAKDSVRLIEIESTRGTDGDPCAETLCHAESRMNAPTIETSDHVLQLSMSSEADTPPVISKKAAQPKPEVIRPRRNSSPRLPLRAAKLNSPTQSRSILPRRIGFWIGCAMGSAAAAVLLMAIRFAVGTM